MSKTVASLSTALFDPGEHEKNRAVLEQAEKIAEDHETNLERAKTVALEYWVVRAIVAGVDEHLMPRILDDKDRQRLVGGAALAAERQAKYKTGRGGKKR